eukprot:CCRYP_001566-RA/>CCRYP_001566-RA protein AED:0.45 eAED:0.61 QI:0/0/0/1/0/0/2/0/107
MQQSILAGIADDLPLLLWEWDRVLPQTKITINLLHQSNATPTSSTYAHLNGHLTTTKCPLPSLAAKSKYTKRLTNAAPGHSIPSTLVSQHLPITLSHAQVPHQVNQL